MMEIALKIHERVIERRIHRENAHPGQPVWLHAWRKVQ